MIDRARAWMQALTTKAEFASATEEHGVLCCDAVLQQVPARLLAVASDACNPFPMARQGEVGLLQGWTLAARVRELTQGGTQRCLVSLVDVPSQAYGRREEALCLSLALAAAVDAYATARRAGHPSVALVLGRAFSGAFLAHGYQASRLLALDSDDVQIQAMSLGAAARITRRSIDEVMTATRHSLPMAYDLQTFSKLGILDERIPCSSADRPSAAEVQHVLDRLVEALRSAALDGKDLVPRINRGGTGQCRDLSRRVRQAMEESWLLA